MTPFDKIESYYKDMTKTDRDIAEYILNNPYDAARGTITAMAKSTKTSKSALVRFANRIGYSGFAEFKFDLSRYLVSHNGEQDTTAQTHDRIKEISDIYSSYILQLQEAVTAEQLRHISEKILKAKRIKIYGSNRTYSSAFQLRNRLAKLGLDAEPTLDNILMLNLADILDENDLLIVFTIADNSNLYNDIVRLTKEHGCPVVCITMTQNLRFKRYCDDYVILPRISRNNAISFLDDQAIFFVFIELLLDATASLAQK